MAGTHLDDGGPDMSLINRIARFASSPQGRRAVGKAKRYAKSPQGRAKIEQVRRQLGARGGDRGRPR
jgi:hypothetical protein